MLDYLAAGGGEAQMGSRLSIDALREIGASDEVSSEDRRRSRHHRRGSSAGSTISDADSTASPSRRTPIRIGKRTRCSRGAPRRRRAIPIRRMTMARAAPWLRIWRRSNSDEH